MTRFYVLLAFFVVNACSQRELLDMDYQTGIEFAHALVAEDFDGAYDRLTHDLKKKTSPEDLAHQYRDMIAYGDGPVTEVVPGEAHSDYPNMKPNELGAIYISLMGDGYVEAVAVFLCEEEGEIRIMKIEWGRP